MASLLSSLVSVADVEAVAVDKLPKSVRDYYQSGADDEETLRRNRRAFKKYLIRPRVLVNVASLDTRVTIRFDEKSVFEFDYPLGLSPSAFHRMAHPEGELATVRAAGATQTPMILSSLSTTRLEDVAAAAPAGTTLWYQLYVYKDRKVTQNLVNRAVAAGFKALVLTVDAPLMGRRRADERNGFELPSHLRLANFDTDTLGKLFEGKSGSSGFGSYVMSLFDLTLDWSSLRWLVKYSPIPVIVKGVIRPEDALKAIECGAKGVMISNHGGRQLDYNASTIEALHEVAKVVRGKVPLLVDGGVRNGTDIFKLIALGADAVFIGRPVIYGLSVGGQQGVEHVIRLLRTEFDYALRLTGTPSVAAIRALPDVVVREEYYAKL